MIKEHRVAIARIVSDMIKADNIIEESEIKDMKRLMNDYSLTQQDMCNARSIKFSDAVNCLQELSSRERNSLFKRIYQIAMSDNICVPREALLLIALQYCLVDIDNQEVKLSRSRKPYLISCATSESTLTDQYMVYLESSYDELRNKDILKNFRLLVSQSKLAGFNFIYIPKLVSEFQNMDSQYVKDVICYMAPNLEQMVIDDVYERLCKMTTSEFFHSVLYERLHVKAIYDGAPSLLINIGTSIVPYCSTDGKIQYYTEFLCVPITKDILSHVDEILGFYQSKVSIRQSIAINESAGQFKYFGFYKALFDFIVAPAPSMPDLIFAGQNIKGRYTIIFRSADKTENVVYLTPKEYVIYMEIVKKTFTSPLHGLPIGAKRTELAPIVTHIRNKIEKNAQSLTFPEQYKPEKIDNKYRIRLSQEKVYVRKYDLINTNVFTESNLVE